MIVPRRGPRPNAPTPEILAEVLAIVTGMLVPSYWDYGSSGTASFTNTVTRLVGGTTYCSSTSEPSLRR
jgi:hypothetical protein